MGRYLDLARDAKAAGNCGKEADSSPQWEEQAQSLVLAGKGYEINELNEISPPSQDYEINEKRSAAVCPPGGRAVILAVPDDVPKSWAQGVSNLLATPPHPAWPEEGWAVLREDALQFFQVWAAQAHALGWGSLDLFGVHAEAPHARLDGMGLVPLLSGRPVVALTEDSAAIGAGSGGALTFLRRKAWPPGRCLLWELEIPS